MAQSIDHPAATKTMNLLLIGCPGHGKSATGNSILGYKAFHTSSRSKPYRTAAEPLARSGTCDGLTLIVVDGVDLAAKRDRPREDDQTHFLTLSKAEQLCPDGVHAILFVAKYGEQYGEREIEIANIIQTHYGKDVVKNHSIFIISHGDKYVRARNDEEFKDFSEWYGMQTPEFRQLLETCDSRCVLFDNKTKDKDKMNQQREQLVTWLTTLPSTSFKGNMMPDQTHMPHRDSRESDQGREVGNPMANRDSERRQREAIARRVRDEQTLVKSMWSNPCPGPPNADLCLLLLGGSGNGKSSTGNSILGKQAFSTIASTGENDETQVSKDVAEVDGRRIMVVDGPRIDVDDSKNFTNMDRIIKGIKQALEFCGYRFSALIITIRYGYLFTNKELEVVRVIKSIFGHDVLDRYGICVMTFGDNFNQEVEVARQRGETLTFDEWCNTQNVETIEKLLQECRQRCALFDNQTQNSQQQQSQVRKLLSMVSGERYNMQEYANAERGRKQLLFEAKLPELERETRQLLEDVRRQMRDIMASCYNQPVTQKQELEKLLQKLDHHSEKLRSPNLQRMVMALHGEISAKVTSVKRDIKEQDARRKGSSGQDRNDSVRPYKTTRQVDHGAVGSSTYSEEQIGHPTSAVRSRVPYSDCGSDDIEPLPTSRQEMPARNTVEHSQGLRNEGWMRWLVGRLFSHSSKTK